MSDPASRIRVMERSLRCFVFAWLGLVPLLGLPFASGAIFLHWQVRNEADPQDNPAHRYLTWGLVLGLLGAVLSLAAVAAVTGIIMNACLKGEL
jgi:hypothetical protein